jgi:hypothetical protein
MAHKLDGVHAGVPLCIMRLRLRMALNSVVCPTRITLGKIGAVIVREVYTSGKEGSMGVC